MGDQDSSVDPVGSGSETPKEGNTDESQHLLATRIQLHLAEYEALMARNTNLLQIQYAFWPIGLVILVGASQIWPSSYKTYGWLIVWITLISLMSVVIAWEGTLCELFGNVTYIEHTLVPLISPIVNTKRFWLYEVYLDVERGKKPMLRELIAPGTAALISALTIWKALPLTKYEWIVVGVIAILLWILYSKGRTAYEMRIHFIEDKERTSSL